MLVLLALVVLAIPVSIIFLLVQVSGLKSRIARLEVELGRKSRPLETPARMTEPVPDQVIEPPPAPAPAPAPAELHAKTTDPVAAVSPWERALAHAAEVKAAGPDQNRPLVIRPDRFADLMAWLRGNWVYAVSAVSLALAGIFFVQYGMERGLLPPGLRVLAAVLFGAGLVAAGEWLRRRHGDEGAASTAFLPSVFSGAGIVTLFAAVLAARQLYGLIGPGVAFAGHLATAALAVAIGWFSGPLLVAVGLLGASAAPFIVGGSSDNIDWLYGYFALVAALGLGVDALRRWAWVSVLALVLAYGGGLVVVFDSGSNPGWIAQLLVLVMLATAIPELRAIPAHAGPATLPALALKGAPGWPVFPVRLALGALIASALGLCLVTLDSDRTAAMLAFAGLAGLALAFLLWAEKAEGLADLALVPTLAFLAALAAGSSLLRDFMAEDISLRAPEAAPSLTASFLLVMATMMTLAYAYRALRPGPWAVPFALAAVLTAPLTAAGLELFWQPARVLGPYPWALHLVALAALMTGFALRFAKADAPRMRRVAHATLSALSLIALALFVLTTKTALTLSLAVLVVVATALDRRFRLPEMSLFLQVGAAVLGYRLLADPGLSWALEAELWPVLLVFGGTIVAMIAALWLLQPLDRPMARAVAESAAAGLAAILANVLITRWLDAEGDMTQSHWGLTLNAMPWLILMLMQLYRARLGGTLALLRRAIAAVAGGLAATALVVAAVPRNPLFSSGPETAAGLVRGPYLLDTLLLAYAVPGLILLAAARRLPGLDWRLRFGFFGTGTALALLYGGLEIRRFWQGDWLGIPGVVQAELYSYTIAMMVLGAGLLYQAIAKGSDLLRRIAMAVIGLTVVKVFLLDAAGLTGLTRVASFAGLGLSLAGLAWLNRWAGRAGDKGGGSKARPDPPLQD